MTLPPTPHQPPDDVRAGRHRRRYRLTWPRLAERILGGWAPTLRMAALLMSVLTAGIVCVLAAWGIIGVACVIILCAMLQRAMSHLPRPLRI